MESSRFSKSHQNVVDQCYRQRNQHPKNDTVNFIYKQKNFKRVSRELNYLKTQEKVVSNSYPVLRMSG